MDDTTFRIEIEKLLVDKEYWGKVCLAEQRYGE